MAAFFTPSVVSWLGLRSCITLSVAMSAVAAVLRVLTTDPASKKRTSELKKRANEMQ